MFKKLDDFSYKRTGLEAFGFYIVATIIGIIIGAMTNVLAVKFLGTTNGLNTFKEQFDASYKVAVNVVPVIAFIYATIFAVLIIKAKNIYKNIWAMLLAILTILATPLIGAILGMIPMAILTTFQNNAEIKEVNQANPEPAD